MRSSDFEELKRYVRQRAAEANWRASQCNGKQQFDSYAMAMHSARKFRNEASVYRCSFCGHWHVGTAEHARKKAKLFKLRKQAV